MQSLLSFHLCSEMLHRNRTFELVFFFFCSNFAPRPAVWAITINFWRGRAAIDCSKAIIGNSRTQTVFPTLSSYNDTGCCPWFFFCFLDLGFPISIQLTLDETGNGLCDFSIVAGMGTSGGYSSTMLYWSGQRKDIYTILIMYLIIYIIIIYIYIYI